MSDSGPEVSLAVRVEQLERGQHRARVAAISIALLLALVTLPAAIGQDGREDMVRASAFVIVDDAGVPKGALGYEDGRSFLSLRDSEGRDRLLVFVDGDDAFLTVSGPLGSVGISDNAESGSRVAISGEHGRIDMSIEDDGPLVGFFDAHGDPIDGIPRVMR